MTAANTPSRGQMLARAFAHARDWGASETVAPMLFEFAKSEVRLAARPADEGVREALEPFAHTGWLTSDTDHTARTVVAHMHPESEREIILSSDDFHRAARVYAALSTTQEPKQSKEQSP